MNQGKTRRRRRGGFTVAEALVALLIFGLLAAAMASMMPAVMDAYYDATAASEATTLCATLTDSITDTLRYATDIRADDPVTFDSDRYGAQVSLGVNAEGRAVARTGSGEVPVLGEGAYPGGLTADVDLTYDTAQGTFTLTVSVLLKGRTTTSNTVTVSPLNG